MRKLYIIKITSHFNIFTTIFLKVCFKMNVEQLYKWKESFVNKSCQRNVVARLIFSLLIDLL